MSFAAALLPATTWQPRANPRWYYRRVTPRLTSEGDEVVLEWYCLNWNVGSQILPWFTGGKSLASSGNWERSWHEVFEEACAANGCSYRRLSGGTTPPAPGTLAGMITIGDGYRGQVVTLRNRSRRNRRTDATNADGTPGYREMQILMSAQGASGSPERAFNGTLAPFVGGNTVQVLDTSRRPAGQPTLRLRLLAPDGTNSPVNLFAGDQIRVRIETANMTVGTKLKIYAADEAQRDISPSIQTGLERACAAANCSVYIPTFNRDGAAGYYRGGEITFGENYDDVVPVDMLFELKGNPDETTTRTLVFIASITAEGDASEFDSIRARGDWTSTTSYRRGDWVTYLADGATYIYEDETASTGTLPSDTARWRPFRRVQTSSMGLSLDIRPFPPRFWELRATVAGGTIVYAIQGPTGAVGDTVQLESTGAPPGFDAALAAAAADHPGIRYANGVLSSIAPRREDSELAFTVPLAGAGKHALRLSEPTGASPIVIGEACVFLTPPVLPAMSGKWIGVNLAGAEFDSDNTPGNYGTHYAYPNATELDYYARKGVNIVRLPTRMERIQDGLFGPLSGTEGAGPITGRQDMRRIDAFIADASAKGIVTIIDIHNYMAVKPIGRIGYDKPVPTAALVDVCVKLAERYADNPLVWIDIMNEPSGDGATPIRTADNMQWVVNAIRARTDFLGKLLVEGCQFSTARNWVANGQAAAFDRFYDPAGNMAFSPHCYFDEDASGTATACAIGAHTRVNPSLEWALATGREIFFGELAGSGTDATCKSVVPAAYQLLANHPACIGWTTWGAGRRWGASYAYRLDPLDYQNGADTPQMAMLLPHLAAA